MSEYQIQIVRVDHRGPSRSTVLATVTVEAGYVTVAEAKDAADIAGDALWGASEEPLPQEGAGKR